MTDVQEPQNVLKAIQKSKEMIEIKDQELDLTQQKLLQLLEHRIQVHLQAETNAFLLFDHHSSHISKKQPKDPQEEDNKSSKEQQKEEQEDVYFSTVKEFLKQKYQSINTSSSSEPQKEEEQEEEEEEEDVNVWKFQEKIHSIGQEWQKVYAHANESFHLVEEMEENHQLVVTKTQALYQSFENILTQVQELSERVELIEKPMPFFLAIDEIASILGFGVKFAPPSSSTSGGSTGSTLPPVQVFQHKRQIDPTTEQFEKALERIDQCLIYLDTHPEYRDTSSYLEAYHTLAIGAIECLKEYAINALEAAKDGVLEAQARSQQNSTTTASMITELDQASVQYMRFHPTVTPCLTAVTKQLVRLRGPHGNRIDTPSVQALSQVCEAYRTQRFTLLSPSLTAYFEALALNTDIVNLLRLGCKYLVRVCELEFQLFVQCFQKEPTNTAVFAFQNNLDTIPSENGGGVPVSPPQDVCFEPLVFQICGTLYNVVRPRMIQQKDLETLCEIIQVIQSEIIEGLVIPRGHQVSLVEPVLQRMIEDAQERLILCIQKYIRDEIETFVPTPEDLNYPNKLEAASDTSNLYATWYPTLEHTLLCLSKVYHFVKMEIFEELATDAIQICTASLKMASADLTVSKGPLHGTLFLVKHLLTLREQITPFDIKYAITSKALDFTSTSDAMTNLLSDVSSFGGFFGFFAHAIPQIQETQSDVKKELESELKRSCTAFIECAMQLTAEPLLTLVKRIGNKSLKECPLATPENINNALTTVSQTIETQMPLILQAIHLYLRNASTEKILFTPIQRNLQNTVENLLQNVHQQLTPQEKTICDKSFTLLLQQLHAFNN